MSWLIVLSGVVLLTTRPINAIDILLQRDFVGGFAFLGVDEVGVDLGGAHVLVRQHFRDGVDVCSHRELECSICDSVAVKYDLSSTSKCNFYWREMSFFWGGMCIFVKYELTYLSVI